MNDFYVYIYLREDGTPYYVGKGKGNRAYLNGRSTPKPPDRSRIQIVKDNLLECDAFNLEKELILQYGRKDLGTGILRNLTNGGEGVAGRIALLESIQKRASKNTGKKRTPEQKERMRQAQLNRKPVVYTAEQKLEISKKISLALKNKPKSEEHKQKLSNHFIGKSNGKRTEETKQKMRKPKSEEHKKAISEGRKLKYALLKSKAIH